jgi:hypothetical protein
MSERDLDTDPPESNLFIPRLLKLLRSSRRLLFEMFVIFVGVLSALVLESAWQDRMDREAERFLLANIRDEIRENSISLGRWLRFHESAVSSSEQLIEQISRVPDGELISVNDLSIADILRTPTYQPELNSLAAALSSGQIALIQSAEIHRALASWSRLLVDAQEEETKGIEIIHGDLLPYLYRNSDIGPAYKWVMQDRRKFVRDSPRERALDTRSDLTASRELANILWARSALSDSAASELGTVRRQMEEILVLIDAELGDVSENK